ncbi:hypothetical protein [Helicobacter bizzozeronii]|uniref:hypothetical protein n=1 Tax=Helicobacter bizzozeronii TaxID=56877 RepID=UPI000CF0BE4B|nr:hypothetical protein [Helicobacter bizzozeronii]
MAVLYNGNTRNWNYTAPGVAKELLITITGCKGEDATGYREVEGYNSYYNRGSNGALVYVNIDNSRINFTIAGGEGSLVALRRTGYRDTERRWKDTSHWGKEAYTETEEYWVREAYYRNGWQRFWGNKAYKNVRKTREVTKYRDKWVSQGHWENYKVWKWNGLQNQVKPTQSGQSVSFICSVRERAAFTSSQDFSLVVYAI